MRSRSSICGRILCLPHYWNLGMDVEDPDAAVALPPPRKKQGVVYKVVLTGGPCAGKTTSLSRLKIFFEGLGWKVYTVPEIATILFEGGVKYEELALEQTTLFQQRALTTLLELEKTFKLLAEEDSRNVLIVCDRGTMDPFAYCSSEQWQPILDYVDSNPVELRDKRYDQVVHMVTAASGAESFYQLENNSVRTEDLTQARERDAKAAESWVGHPCFDLVDNSTGFEEKIHRVIEKVCERMRKRGLQLDIDDRLKAHSKKRKFLVKSLPDEKEFPAVQDFDVQHDYIESRDSDVKSRIRKRGQNGSFTYTITDWKIVSGERVEKTRPISHREYKTLYRLKYPDHVSIKKIRRCFLWNRQYFQLDIYTEGTEKCSGLLLLETYTTKEGDHLKLPEFLEVDREVTDDSHYSMFQLSYKDPTPP